jgi:hypothetical protein
MLIKKYILVIIIIFWPLILNAQEIVNPLTPQPKSDEFLQFINFIDNNNITLIKQSKHINSSTSVADMNLEDVKKLVALSYFSRLYNPIEFAEKIKKHGEQQLPFEKMFKKNYFAAAELFTKKDQYYRFKFNNKHILSDLYFGPFVFIGTITTIDTIHQFDGSDIKIIKYEMIILDNLNKFYKRNVLNKKIIFLFSTGRWHSFFDHNSPRSYIIPDEVKINLTQKFTISKQYLVFLRCTTSNFTGIKSADKELSHLHLTAYGDLNFPVDDSCIIDANEYFGQGKRVELKEVKIIINSILDELSNWRK